MEYPCLIGYIMNIYSSKGMSKSPRSRYLNRLLVLIPAYSVGGRFLTTINLPHNISYYRHLATLFRAENESERCDLLKALMMLP